MVGGTNLRCFKFIFMGFFFDFLSLNDQSQKRSTNKQHNKFY